MEGGVKYVWKEGGVLNLYIQSLHFVPFSPSFKAHSHCTKSKTIIENQIKATSFKCTLIHFIVFTLVSLIWEFHHIM